MMVLAAPTLPAARAVPTPATIYGASVLVLPDASLDAVSGPRVAVHAGRDQRGAALRDGVARRHPRRVWTTDD